MTIAIAGIFGHLAGIIIALFCQSGWLRIQIQQTTAQSA
jgi:hypothetical protein